MQLRSKLSYYSLITASVAVPLIIFCITAWLHHRALIQEASRDSTVSTSLFEQHALNLFDTHRLLSERITDHLAVMRQTQAVPPEKIASYLKQLQLNHPQVDGIWLIDRTGTVQASSHELPISSRTVAGHDYFKTVRDATRSFHICKGLNPRAEKEPGINFIYRKTDSANNFDGMIVIFTAPKHFRTYWMSFATTAETVALIQSNGRVLTASHPLDQLLVLYPPDSVQNQALRAADSGSYIAKPSHGEHKQLYAFRKIHKYNLYVLYSKDLSAVLASWRTDMLLYGIFFSFASLVLLVLVLGNSETQDKLEQRVEARTALLNQEIAMRKQFEEQLIANQQKQADMATELSLLDQQVRLNIATELHDQIGQSLLLCRIKLATLHSTLCAQTHAGATQDILRLLDDSIQQVRTLTMQLSPPILTTAGLEAALEWLCNQMREDYGLYLCFEHDPTEKPLSEVVRSVAYQAARELLINVAKHAEATIAWITLKKDVDFIVLTVQDDGIGFAPDHDRMASASDGFGLFNIRRQINFLGGDLNIASRHGQGTTVTIRIPLRDTRAEQEGRHVHH